MKKELSKTLRQVDNFTLLVMRMGELILRELDKDRYWKYGQEKTSTKRVIELVKDMEKFAAFAKEYAQNAEERK